MKQTRYYYLIRIQYLGFRYSGWQRQPNQRTIEGMLTKTLKFILPNNKFKILGSGRTDAKVSALDGIFEIFLENAPLGDLEAFLSDFNRNLPADIRALGIEPTSADFNIIKHCKAKEYVYLFSFGEKNHPFCAPFLYNILDELDVQRMQEAAQLFVGTFNFKSYTARPQPNTQVIRTIDHCEIRINDLITANFMPKRSYALVVRGPGFMRYQVRMMMAALIQVGKGEWSKMDILDSFDPDKEITLTSVAPGSGLLLHQVNFDEVP